VYLGVSFVALCWDDSVMVLKLWKVDSIMKWSKEKPTVEGFYWVKVVNPITWRYDTSIVQVFPQSAFFEKPDTIRFNNECYTLTDSRFYVFSGPIPLPEPCDVA
jgi:hypothetical protein